MNWPLRTVYLNVADLGRSVEFYEHTIGLVVHNRNDDTATMGAAGAATPLLHLTEKPQGRHSEGGTGLYHFAILVPSRLELAKVLRHFAETQTPLQGLSDHYVSEAIYLADPDNNGIEIYRDLPRNRWEFSNGQITMGTVYMDVEGVLAELNGHDAQWTGLASETILGHMHLHVSDLAATKTFYGDLLGLDLMVNYGGAALFMSFEGYHHHLGLNTWKRGKPSVITPDTLGLRWYTLDLGEHKADVLARLEATGIPLEQREDGLFIRDPAQNGIFLV